MTMTHYDVVIPINIHLGIQQSIHIDLIYPLTTDKFDVHKSQFSLISKYTEHLGFNGFILDVTVTSSKFVLTVSLNNMG